MAGTRNDEIVAYVLDGLASLMLIYTGWRGFNIGRAYFRARTWDGVTCCDPLENVGWGFFIFLCLVSTGLIVASVVFRRRADG